MGEHSIIGIHEQFLLKEVIAVFPDAGVSDPYFCYVMPVLNL